MSKVIMVTILMELTDKAPDPGDWDWSMMQRLSPDPLKVICIDSMVRPFNTLEEDPLANTQH